MVKHMDFEDIKTGMKLKLREDLQHRNVYGGIDFVAYKMTGFEYYTVAGFGYRGRDPYVCVEENGCVYSPEMFECEIKEEPKVEKVKVNKAVAELLRKAKKRAAVSEATVELKVWHFLELVAHQALFEEWFKKNKITLHDVISAFEHGWEEEYELKEGDLISFKMYSGDKHLREIKRVGDCRIYFTNEKHLDKYDKSIKLVCKKENREDLK